jgi:preprotein translocase subunit SecF
MQLFSRVPKFDFVGRRNIAFAVSILLVGASLVSMAVRGFNFGIDFTGGVLVEVAYQSPVDLEDLRTTLAEAGFTEATLQAFGSARNVLIRLPPDENAAVEERPGTAVYEALRARDPTVRWEGGTFVGPQVGEDLADQSGLALFFATIMIFIYTMLRFRWKFAAAAIVALVHDGIVTLGLFSITGLTFDLTVLAAVLAVIGYSLNDTVVVFDRVRENFRAMRRSTPSEIMNASNNQTLARTFVTALTVLLVLISLLVLGGEAVYGFSLGLIVGVVVGSYTTVYIATNVALLLKVTPVDLMPPKREAADDLP